MAGIGVLLNGRVAMAITGIDVVNIVDVRSYSRTIKGLQGKIRISGLKLVIGVASKRKANTNRGIRVLKNVCYLELSSGGSISSPCHDHPTETYEKIIISIRQDRSFPDSETSVGSGRFRRRRTACKR